MLIDAGRMLLGRDATDKDLDMHRQAWVMDHTFTERNYETTWIEVDDQIVAYVNEGRWVADCPYCNGGIAIPMKTQHDAACYDCGRIYKNIDRPSGSELRQAEHELEKRPMNRNRNWNRHSGEKVSNLQQENLLMAKIGDI